MVLCILLICLVGYSFGSSVIDLNPDNFKSFVLESEGPFFVEFFAPWCGHCQRLAPEWEKSATNLKGIVPLGKVDCTVHQGLCSQYQVQGYPTIKLFSEKGKKVVDYQQARQAGAIVRFATESIPNIVSYVSDESGLQKFLNTNPSIPHTLIFSSKPEVSALMKSLALSFKNRISFGQAKKEANSIIEKYSVSSFPKILVLNEGQEPVTYEGAINADELNAFLSGFAGETVVEAPVPPPVVKPKPKVEVSFVEVTDESLGSTCTGLCLLAFVSTSENSPIPEHQKIMDEILSNFKSDGKFTFGWVNFQTATNLNAKFGISQNSVVVFNGKRSKYVKNEDLEWKSIFRLVEHVLTGDAHYTAL